MLSDTPRQKLAAMIALDGIKIASDAKLCEALLRDYCGEYRLEIAALTAAVRWGIPKSLNEHGLTPAATLRATLARRLQENHGLAEESAYWAVDAWASVLSQTGGVTAAVEPPGGNPAAGFINDTRSMPGGQLSPPAQPPQSPPQSPYQPPSPPLPPLPKEPSGPQAAPPPRPPYQPQSPSLPPLPKPPSGPQASPSPKSPYQAPPPSLPPPPKSPYVPPPLPASANPRPSPPLPKTPSAPPASPPLPPLPKTPYVPPPLPAQSYQHPSPPLPQPFQTPSPVAPQAPPLSPLLLTAAAQAFESRQTTPQLVQVQGYLKTELKKRKHQVLSEELRIAGVQPFTAIRMVSEQRRSVAGQHLGIAVAVFAGSIVMVWGSALLHLGLDEFSYLLCGCAFIYLLYRGVQLIGTF
jgi:hypothetical protein